MWCLRVPTGAFVAVRNGVAFPTGNSGFPKSLDVSKAIDKAAGAEREVIGTRKSAGGRTSQPNTEGIDAGALIDITAPATEAAQQWQGWGTALKPALEPITMARKPLIGTVVSNVLAHGTGGLNIDGCRVGYLPDERVQTFWNNRGGATINVAEGVGTAPKTGEGAYDPSKGRWPANLILQDSDEVRAGFPVTSGAVGMTQHASGTNSVYGDFARTAKSTGGAGQRDDGSAARFFYCAKASKKDRDEGLESFIAAKTNDGRAVDADNAYQRGASLRQNTHPTVKPTDLMAYLCRLVTPPGGVVLDPFMGSGSTGKAALREGFGFIGCEMSPEYTAIARARIEAALAELYV